MSARIKGNIAAFVAMILWATGFPVTVAILETWNPLLLAPFRLGMSALMLLAILAVTGGLKYLRHVNWWDVTWIGGGILAVSTILLLYGQNLAHPITVAVIISMMPLISAVMGMASGQERLTIALGIGIVLSIVGGIVTSYTPASGDSDGSLIGALLVLVSISLFVAYTRIVDARFPGLPDVAKSGLTCLAATIVVGDLAFAAAGWDIVALKVDFSPQSLALIGWLGAVSFGLAMALWFASVRLIGTTVTTMHHNIVPFYVILMSLAVGGTIATHHLIGAGLVVAGAVVAQLAPVGAKRTRAAQAPQGTPMQSMPAQPHPHGPAQQPAGYAHAATRLHQPPVSNYDPPAPQGPAHTYARPLGAAVIQNEPPPRKSRDVEKGMLIMACAMLWLPLIDTFAKLASSHIEAGQISWSRFLFQTLLLAPLALMRIRTWQLSQMPVHAARGALIAIATLFFFAALKFLPLADAISIFFIEPLILTLLSFTILGETIGWRRLTAIVVGFVGALIVIQPSYEVFGVRALLPLGTAVSFAFYLMLTRRVAQREDPVTIQFMAGVFGLVLMTAALFAGPALDIAVITPVWPTPYEWLLLIGVGVVATTGHLMVVHAFKRAEAGILAPFQYLEIIPSVILGLVIFGDFPNLLTWCGIAIIVGSGVYVFHRERAVAREEEDRVAFETAPIPPPQMDTRFNPAE
ncbi:MAG: EamA family transporter [Hyphomicrobiaceae bacterium]